MRTPVLACALIVLFGLGMVSPVAAAGEQAPRMTVGGLTIEGESWQGNFQQQGPWECKGPVTVTSSGFTLTCETSFKLWPTADLSDFGRAEATGNVRVEGRYVTADSNAWDITGHADSATYDRESQRAILSGAVSFKATNSVTGAVLTAAAEELTYDANTQGFSFERGKEQVRLKWLPPPTKTDGQDDASPGEG